MHKKSEIDYINTKEDMDILKDYYSITYIRKNYIDSNYYALKKHLKISDDESLFHSSKWYIKKECIERYLEAKNRNKTLIAELKNLGYFHITECLEKYSIKEEASALNNFIKHRKGVDLKKDNTGRLFIHKDSFDRFLFEHEYRKNSYDFIDIMKLLNFDHTTLHKHTMINFRKVLKEKLDNEKFGNLIYYKKDSFHALLKEYNNSSEEMFKFLFGKIKLYYKNDIEKNDASALTELPDNYLTLQQMATKYNKPLDYFEHSITRNLITDLITFKSCIYMNSKEYDTLIKQNQDSMSIYDIKELMIKKSKFNNFKNLDLKNLCSKYFPNSFICKLGQSHRRIYKKDVWDFFEKYFEELDILYKCKKEKDCYKILELQLEIKLQNINFQDTFNELKKYAIHRLNKTRVLGKDKKMLAYRLADSITIFLSNITKEFYLLTDDDILEILDCIDPIDIKQIISTFLNYYLERNPNKCLYRNTFNAYITIDNTHTPESESIYTEEEWISYLKELTDIDKHIKKAFNSYRYSRVWLFTLLHYVMAWRKSTLLQIGALEHLNVDRYTQEWFQSNIFTMTDAQQILNDTKLHFDNSIINKNQVKNHFVVYENIAIPLAIAIAITENHRRKNEFPELFNNLQIYSNVYHETLGEHMSDFRSLKANSSFITYCFNEAVAKVGYSHIAYSLSSSLRRHKLNKFGLAPVTVQYIYATNNDGDCENVAFQLQKRGVFGWLYKTILTIAYSTGDMNQEELTNMICKAQQLYSVKNLEGMSRFLNNHFLIIKDVISELIQTDKELLKEKLHNLLNGCMPSKISNTYCWKANQCPYKNQNSCSFCRYSIPTTYTLLTINKQILNLMNELTEVIKDDENERIYYTHKILKLMNILQEAKRDFINYDSENKAFFETFLDIDAIQDKFKFLQQEKLLLKQRG